MLDVVSSSGPVLSFSPKHIAKAEAHVGKILRRAEAAHKAGNKGLFRHLATQYLQSRDGRALATREAYRSMKWNRRPKRLELPYIAASLNAWGGSVEPAIVNFKRKPDSRFRLILDFGIENRALQYLLLRLLKTAADLHPHQYATRGGVPAAIDYVAASLLEGFVWTIETDIANCFPSFNGEVYKFLPVPKDVIHHVVMADHLTVTPGTTLLHHFGTADDDPGDPIALAKYLAEARQGIPQGSAVSSLVAEMLLATPLKTLPSVGRVANYADNMLTMAKTESEAVSIIEALWNALKTHPVGLLTPKIQGNSDPGGHVDFLGHRLCVIGTTVKITPTPENENKFRRRLKSRLASLGDPSLPIFVRRAKARELKSWISSWQRTFHAATA
jgi:hypothetical protein